MSHIPTHRPSIGQAAHGRHEIKALKDVGRTPGGIQYRTQTGAQAELTLPTATDFLLGNDGLRPTWVSATQVATATQPVLSYLYAVTASASQIFISWASVATQYTKFEVELFKFQTATPAKIAARFSTDGITPDTATNSTFWAMLETTNRPTPANAAFGSTSTNAASQAVLTGTGHGIAGGFHLNGRIEVWPDSDGNTMPPNIEWMAVFFSTDSGDQTLVRTAGAAHYWPMVDIRGLALFPVVGAASFTDGLAKVYGHV